MATIASDVGAAAPPPSRRRWRAPKWGLALPLWFWFVFFFLVPIAFIVVYSFGYKPAAGAKGAVGLDRLSWDNYSKVLDTSGPLYETFRQTLIIVVTGTVLCLLIAFPFAYWLATKVPPKWKGVLLALIIVPFWTSFLIRTIAWRIVLAPKGLIASWLQQLGAISGPLSILDTRQAVQLGVVYNYLPLMIFPLFVTLDRLDPALREASKDLGATRWRTFTQVTLPLSMPGVVAGLLLVYIPLAGDYITASVLGGAKGNMAGALVASQFQAAQNQSLGSAMAVVLIAMIMLTIGVVALVALLVRWAVRRVRGMDIGEGGPPLPITATAGGSGMSTATSTLETTAVSTSASPPKRRRKRVDVLTLGMGVWAVLVYVFLFLPIVFVVAHSFNGGRSFLVWDSFSTKPFSDFWEDPVLKNAILTSLKVAVGSTMIATVLGGFAGVALARRGGGWVKPFMFVLLLVLVTPEIVDAIGYLIWFVRLGGPLNPQHELLVPAGLLRLWIGHSVFSAAVVTLIVRARLAGLDESLEEAAADLGATPARAFRQITLPLMAPALVAGALLSFTFSLDNTIISTFVGVAGSTTFPAYVFGSVRAVLRPYIGAAATVMLLLTLVSLALVGLVLRRSGDSSTDVAATLTGG